MSTIIPHGEQVRRAVRWLSDERTAHAERPIAAIVEEAALRFDLTPREAEWLWVTFVGGEPPGPDAGSRP